MADEREDRRVSEITGCIPERRQTDARLRKVEDSVTYIRAKLDNGLSERTRKNSQQLEELIDKHNDFQTTVFTTLAHNSNQVTHIKNAVGAMSENVETVKKTHEKWNGLLMKFLWGVAGLSVICAGMVVVHSDKISKVLQYINENVLTL